MTFGLATIKASCDWINTNNFHYDKAATVCKQLKERHTYDVIASEIELIHSVYGLSRKDTATVTDNRTNFLKAFKMYEPTASGSDEEDEEQAVTFTDVGNVRSTYTDQGHFSLLLYLRYTLNLISSNDVDKWLTANTYQSPYQCTEVQQENTLAFGLDKNSLCRQQRDGNQMS